MKAFGGIGLSRDGGTAEYACVPARQLLLPVHVPVQLQAVSTAVRIARSAAHA